MEMKEIDANIEAAWKNLDGALGMMNKTLSSMIKCAKEKDQAGYVEYELFFDHAYKGVNKARGALDHFQNLKREAEWNKIMDKD